LSAHAGDGKPVGLVTNLGHQHQRGRVFAQIDLVAAIGKHQLFQPHLAALAFFNAHDQ
jgi:ribonucleotide monophosphatase NagD (HAD superfamily)